MVDNTSSTRPDVELPALEHWMSPGNFVTLRTWVRESFEAGVNLCLHCWYALWLFGEAYELGF